jgi:polar amino acid transport system substrate-binding protein
MRRSSVALAVCSLIAAVALPAGATGPAAPGATPTLRQCVTAVKAQVLNHGHLTVATDNPVYAPWFLDDTPSNGQGYESALAYALAKDLGFPAKQVRWVSEPFADSYAAGAKDFDVDVNEVAYNAQWAQNVTFSNSYYDVNQSLVAMKSDPIVKHHTPTQLPAYRYGALAGSPALDFVTTLLKPTVAPVAYSSLGAAEQALEANKIDAIAVDTPTGNHMVTWDIVAADGVTPLATQFGQFPANGDEYYAMVLAKKNPLAVCVNVAVAALHRAGTIAALTNKWLKIYTSVPTIKP